jgi:hypothetical protein
MAVYYTLAILRSRTRANFPSRRGSPLPDAVCRVQTSDAEASTIAEARRLAEGHVHETIGRIRTN